MEVLVIDSDPAARAVLLGRLNELKRVRELQTIEPVPLLPKSIKTKNFGAVGAIVLGPGLAQTAESIRAELSEKSSHPTAALFSPAPRDTVSIALDNDEALKLFLIQAIATSQLAKIAEARKTIGVAQFAGGVGASTLAIELGKGISKAGKTTLIDFDDVSANLSVWGKAAPRYRAAVSDALLRGSVNDSNLPGMLCPVSDNLFLVPQPESYAEAFHYKANVLENAPVSSLMINSLLSSLRAQDHTVIIDLSRSWGLATFAALPRCGQILFVIAAQSSDRVKMSIECLRRFKKESDTGEEFDLARWQIVVTRYDPNQIEEIKKTIHATTLFPESVLIHFISDPASAHFANEMNRLIEYAT